MTSREAHERYMALLQSTPLRPTLMQRLELAEARLEYEKAAASETIRHESR